jgi:broad specificity phosphatase PhoE
MKKAVFLFLFIGSTEDAGEKIRLSMAERRFTWVWASPVERCKGPACFLADKLGVPLCTDPRLKEICLGDWQLRSWTSIEASEPELDTGHGWRTG